MRRSLLAAMMSTVMRSMTMKLSMAQVRLKALLSSLIIMVRCKTNALNVEKISTQPATYYSTSKVFMSQRKSAMFVESSSVQETSRDI